MHENVINLCKHTCGHCTGSAKEMQESVGAESVCFRLSQPRAAVLPHARARASRSANCVWYCTEITPRSPSVPREPFFKMVLKKGGHQKRRCIASASADARAPDAELSFCRTLVCSLGSSMVSCLRTRERGHWRQNLRSTTDYNIVVNVIGRGMDE